MSVTADEAVGTAVLRFHEQMDGRKVSRLPGGKVVLVDLLDRERVTDGAWWRVRLEHRDTFAIAHLLERADPPVPTATPAPPTAPPRAPAAAAGGAVALRATAKATVPSSVAAPAASAERRAPPSDLTLHDLVKQAVRSLGHPKEILRASDRVAMFVDSANMDHAARHLGFFVDWKRAHSYFMQPGTPYGAFFYIGTYGEDDPAQKGFLDFLSYNGYIVRTKAAKALVDDDTGEHYVKANLDVEIVLDMLNTVDNWDACFLFSGDGDFARAVDLLRSRGKRVYVVAGRGSLARELAYVADKPIFFLDDHEEHLARSGRAPREGWSGRDGDSSTGS